MRLGVEPRLVPNSVIATYFSPMSVLLEYFDFAKRISRDLGDMVDLFTYPFDAKPGIM